MKCADCKVGPGKFEGEPAVTYVLYLMGLDGYGDESAGDEQGTSAELFKGPCLLSDTSLYAQVKGYGYCEGCIAEAGARLNAMIGAILQEGSQGFVTSATYAKGQEDEMARRWAEIEVELGNGFDED